MVSTPANGTDLERQMIFAAFVLSRYSGQLENIILNKLVDDAGTHSDVGNWAEKFGFAVAMFARTADGLDVKIGKLECH